MRICIVHYRYFVHGGPERYLFGVKELLEARGHEVIPFSVRYSRNEPTPWASSSMLMTSTLPTSTATGPPAPAGWVPGAATTRGAPAFLFWYHHAAPPATEMPTTATTVCKIFTLNPGLLLEGM